MGRFYTSNVAKIELHDFVAIVNLQAHCIWFQRRNFVKLTIKHVVVGGATNDVAPRHEPKSLIIKLMRRFDICAAVLVVQEVVYLFVEFSSLRVAHCKAPVGHVVLVLELVHQHPHAAFDVLVNQAHIKLEEGQVGAPAIGREIHAVVVAETDKNEASSTLPVTCCFLHLLKAGPNCDRKSPSMMNLAPASDHFRMAAHNTRGI